MYTSLDASEEKHLEHWNKPAAQHALFIPLISPPNFVITEWR